MILLQAKRESILCEALQFSVAMEISLKVNYRLFCFCLGNGYIHHRPLPFVQTTTVLDGSKMANTYPANAFAQSAKPFPHIGMFNWYNA